jgi:hypothetical protein
MHFTRATAHTRLVDIDGEDICRLIPYQGFRMLTLMPIILPTCISSEWQNAPPSSNAVAVVQLKVPTFQLRLHELVTNSLVLPRKMI